MLKSLAIKLTNVLLDVAATVYVWLSKSPPVVFNAVIQNLLGYYSNKYKPRRLRCLYGCLFEIGVYLRLAFITYKQPLAMLGNR